MDKILIFGDSIAYGKWDTEGGWVARLRKSIDSERNMGKSGNVQIYNLGIPGEVAVRMVTRFETELSMRITSESKNLVLIAIGINDSCPNNWMVGKQSSETDFKASVREMITISQKHGCKVGLIGLTPVDSTKTRLQSFSNKHIEQYNSFLSQVAIEESVPMLSLFNKLNSEVYLGTIVDDAHPNERGHQMIFEAVKEFVVKELW